MIKAARRAARSRTVLLTGATGFLGVQTLRQLVREGYGVCALARGNAPGRDAVRALELLANVRFVAADITKPRLGLDEATIATLRDEVGSVVHAAAHYSLDVDGPTAWQANVVGTTNLLELIESWDLSAIHYVSSITVAGDAAGRVEEAELSRPERFRNHYEQSKWTAERVVLRHAAHPVRVYRAGIIVGDSGTGWTQKFDGPYPAFRLMRPFVPFAIPGEGRKPFPLVTVDVVAGALVAGLGRIPTRREILHVIDLDPPTLREFAEAMALRIAGHRNVVGLPVSVFRSLTAVPGFAGVFGITPQAVEYMWANSTFDTSAFAAFCRDTGVDARRLKDSYDALALYYGLSTARQFRGDHEAAS